MNIIRILHPTKRSVRVSITEALAEYARTRTSKKSADRKASVAWDKNIRHELHRMFKEYDATFLSITPKRRFYDAALTTYYEVTFRDCAGNWRFTTDDDAEDAIESALNVAEYELTNADRLY